jgi:hypothetical protein
MTVGQIFFELRATQVENRKYFELLATQVENWKYLLSQGQLL